MKIKRSIRAMNPHSTKAMVNIMAKNRGLQVQYHREAMQPYTDPSTKTLHVSEPMGWWSDEQIAVWNGEIMHELGHWRGINAQIMEHFYKKGTNMKSLYGTLVNMFADRINDYQWTAERYDGAARDVTAAQLWHGRKGIESVSKNIPKDDKSRLLCECFSWYYTRRAETFQRGLLSVARDWQSVIPIPANLSALDAEFDALCDAASIEDLIAKILPPEEIQKGNEPQPGQEKQPGGKEGKGEGEGEEGKGKAKGKAKGKGEGDPADGEAWVRYRDLLPDDHADPAKGKTGLKILYDHEYQYGSYIWSEGHDIHTENVPESPTEREYNSHYEAEMREHSAKSASLAAQITRMIQVRSQRAWEHNQKRGRISTRALARVPTGKEDIFKRKSVPRITKDCAILVLGDMSGSMMGEKYSALGASMILLNEACQKVGIPFELDMFTQRGRRPQYHVIKSFNSRVSTDELCDKFVNRACAMGHNADGEALLWAHSRLSQRSEKKKILIVLSDGQPATNHQCGDAAAHLKEVAARLEDEITLVAIGLLSESVNYFYKNRHVIRDVNELEGMFLNLLQEHVI